VPGWTGLYSSRVSSRDMSVSCPGNTVGQYQLESHSQSPILDQISCLLQEKLYSFSFSPVMAGAGTMNSSRVERSALRLVLIAEDAYIIGLLERYSTNATSR